MFFGGRGQEKKEEKERWEGVVWQKARKYPHGLCAATPRRSSRFHIDGSLDVGTMRTRMRNKCDGDGKDDGCGAGDGA